MNSSPVKLIFAGPQILACDDRNADAGQCRKKAEIIVAAGSDCEVGVKRYADWV